MSKGKLTTQQGIIVLLETLLEIETEHGDPLVPRSYVWLPMSAAGMSFGDFNAMIATLSRNDIITSTPETIRLTSTGKVVTQELKALRAKLEKEARDNA